MIDGGSDDGNGGTTAGEASDASNDSVVAAGEPYQVRHFSAEKSNSPTTARGRRTKSTNTPIGHTIRTSVPQQRVTRLNDLSIDGTLRAAALRRSDTGEQADERTLDIQRRDHRVKVRAAKAPNLILFVVDASSSMATKQRMIAVKGAILSLLLDAYQKRDRVGLITFRGRGAQLVLPPTRSVELAQRHLQTLPTGGRTPLSHALVLTFETLQRYVKPDTIPLLIIISDCRGNVALNGKLSTPTISREIDEIGGQIGMLGISSLVIDCEQGIRRYGLARQLATAMGGTAIELDEISADSILQTVQQVRG
jgi:magnesium chelatase subunit D